MNPPIGKVSGFNTSNITMPLPHVNDLESPFMRLSEIQKEELFALSCFDEAHWEDAPSWNIDGEEVTRKLDKYLQELYGSSWRAIQRKGNLRSIRANFSHGGMTNELLSWYIADRTDFYCKTESRNTEKEFDLQLMEDGIPVCDIGIKRLATSRQMRDNLEQHRKKCTEIGEADHTLLLNFFPTTSAAQSERVLDFVVGYGYVSEDTHSFYSENSAFVANIPTPIKQETNSVRPLDEVVKILRGWLGSSR